MKALTTNFDEAVRMLVKYKHGKLLIKDGLIISGSLYDTQDENNDPEGIGYISIDEGVPGLVSDVYADEFEALLEVW